MRRATLGLSLIEVMIAITLGLLILATLGYVVTGSRNTYRSQDASARLQDTGRFAMDFIGRQIRAAGRVDISPIASDLRTDALGLQANWTPITGIHNAAAVAINGGTRQTDTMTLQYVFTDSGTKIQDCNDNGNGIAKNDIQRSSGIAFHWGVVTNTISLDTANLALRCKGNGGIVTQPFTEGVEDLHIRYAEASAPGVFNAVPANFANVVAVEVCIMVQSTYNGVVNAPQTLVDCSGNSYTPNDTRLRRTFSSVFTLRSRMP